MAQPDARPPIMPLVHALLEDLKQRPWRPSRKFEAEPTVNVLSRVREVRPHAAAHWLAKEGAPAEFALSACRDICKHFDFDIESPLGHALVAAAAELAALSPALWFVPSEADLADMTLDEQVAYRHMIDARAAVLSNADECIEGWARMTRTVLGSLIDLIPSIVREAEQYPHAPRFGASIIELLEEPAETLDELIVYILELPGRPAGVYSHMQMTLNQNILKASGLSPSEPLPNNFKPTLPSDHDEASLVELVHRYFSDTPLDEFLTTELRVPLSDAVRHEHQVVIGGTGHGKSQCLLHFIRSDIERVRDGTATLIVIDSQGDLIRTISHLDCFNPLAEGSLADRLVLIDPEDAVEHPTALNLFYVDRSRLAGYTPAEHERVLNSAIELYEYIFGSLFGAELTSKMDVVFRYLAVLLMEIPDATIQTLRELLEDGSRFRPYWQQLEGTARMFFEQEFMDRSFSATKKQIRRRLYHVLSNGTLERMFSHPENKVDLFEEMNTGKVILINTAKDLLKREGSEIFGRFFIAMIAQAALERSTIPESERLSTMVFCDEAHEYFSGGTIEHILAQARKYKVGITLAFQNLQQVNASLRASIMANAAIKLAGGVSAKDAKSLAPEMNCDGGFIRSMRKRSTYSDFACSIKNLLPRPLPFRVRLGHMDDYPKLDEEQYQSLVEANRTRYAASLEETREYIRRSHATFRSPQERRRGSGAEEGKAVSSTASAPTAQEAPRAVIREQPSASPTPLPAAKRSAASADPYLQGQGGREHRYVQQLIKKAAQDRGFMAQIEHGLDGGEKVDVALSRGGTRIACEVTITTKPEHELGNIEKCLAAGYGEVIVVSSSRKQLRSVRRFVEWALAESDGERVHFLLPNEVIARLDEKCAAEAGTENTILGYKVKVRHSAIDPEEADKRRSEIASVIVRSLTRMKSEEVT